MRWKLLLVTSLLATLVGAGASLGIVYGLTGSIGRVTSPDAWVVGALLIPLAAIAFASFFVYRHTARRRSAQAMATALLATILSLAALFTASVFFKRPTSDARPAPTPLLKEIGSNSSGANQAGD